jgi:hypothetical protein
MSSSPLLFTFRFFKILFQERRVKVFKVVSLGVRRLDLQVFTQTRTHAHTHTHRRVKQGTYTYLNLSSIFLV